MGWDRGEIKMKKQDKEIGKLKQEIKKLIANLKKMEKEFEKE